MLLPTQAGGAGPDADEVKAVRDRAVAFLRKQQGADGSFSPKIAGPGVTALVAAALVRNGVSTDDPTLARALGYIAKSAQKDGGIYSKMLANYTTCVALMALKEANKDGKYDTLIKNAVAFLKKLQAEDVAEKDVKFGGVGYGGKGRPDLSNTQYFVEALIAAGVPKNDPAIKNALKFITRCQNYTDKEEGNDQPFAKKAKPADKGGFTYVPIDSDDNPHATGDGGLRSLGAMTYAGLKSFLYAGVSKDDPRVKGALGWIRRHYTLDENPGMKQSGLFYYYHTFAKAMDALGIDEFEDARSVKHDWRRELFAALKKRQTAAGGFLNKGDKAFGEQDPNLATAFALLSLSYVQKK
jgi:squalene-hopene/tetraprenyl-beta-curcumene cyclase